MTQPKTIKIDEVEYIRVDAVKQKAEQVDGMDYVIVRTYSAGVHAGYLKERNGREVALVNSRRLYYWDGAFTLSTVATKGVSKPKNCKFPNEVPEILLLEAVEVIPCSEEARLSIKNVPAWKNS
ncbi:hypothetical protein KC902_04780 [Candidatus Kaiserbacteria bacterium]|nr:hypothetical protein [Candidatus Kaiserbacteria bacterium]